MDEMKFWEIVQTAHDRSDGDMERKCDAIKTIIAELDKAEALAFSYLFDDMMDKAYSWPLWGAAYIINGGCGDDTFTDFRASLISRGQAVYEKVVSNPESLADESYDEEAWFYEGYQYAVGDGVEAATGFVPPRHNLYPQSPSGEEWTEEQVYQLFPKLSEKFK